MLTLLLLSCTSGPAEAPPLADELPAASTPPLMQAPPASLGELYAAAGQSTVAYERLRYLSDHIGHRIAGSQRLDRAISWARDELAADGFDVSLEPVEVPRWVRGEERLVLVSPEQRQLGVLGLGHTPGTDGVIEADVLVLPDLEAVEALPEGGADGKVVLIDRPFTTYGETVKGRSKGPGAAGRKGAVGLLIRSVGSESLYTTHTGMMHTDEEGIVPAAAMTWEDAAWLHRLSETGITPRVRLELGARMDGTVTSHNVVVDLVGAEKPDEIVLVGCHLDSWDVGQGAQDDGAGCLIAWEALRLIAARDQRPRRTVRLVLFTAEEIGVLGGNAYAEAHADDQHVALLESDTGNGRATGFRVDLRDEDPDRGSRVTAFEAELSAALTPLGGGTLRRAYGGADISPVVNTGPLGFGMDHDTSTYWPIHHTWADTFDKIVLEDLQHNAGLMAATVSWLADYEGDLP